MKIFKLLFIIIFCNFTVFADPFTKIVGEKFFNEEHILTLKNADRCYLIQQYPDLLEIHGDNDFELGRKYYWYDINPKSTLEFKILSRDEMMKLNSHYINAEAFYNDLTLVIQCAPYILVVASYEILSNEIRFEISHVIFTSNFILKQEIPLSEDVFNKYFAKIFIDGDYIKLYINDIYVQTFCRLDKNTIEQYDNLILSNKYDNSKVTWPRHADGTSDFDNKIIIPEQIITDLDVKKFKENEINNRAPKKVDVESVKKQKVYRINQNIPLYSEPRNYKLDTLLPNTEIKILKIGPKDEINNIKSNWVKIIVINNVKTINNQECKGVTAWIFGGYLE